MKQFRLFLLFVFCILYNRSYSQQGNYINRDSTYVPCCGSGPDFNTILGRFSAYNIDTARSAFGTDHNVIIGSYSGYKLGKKNGPQSAGVSDNTFIGAKAGYNATGIILGTTYIGSKAGYNSTSRGSTFIGYKAGYAEGYGEGGSVAIGYESGLGGVGYQSIYIGSGTARLSGAANNLVIGSYAATKVTSEYNTILGTGAGRNDQFGVAFGENVLVGAFSGGKGGYGYNTMVGTNSGLINSTGYDNTFVGHNTGVINSSGRANTFIGRKAGISNTSGYDNTFVGFEAGKNIRMGSSNTFIGYGSGVAVKDSSLQNATAIGYNSVVAASNSVILGSNANVGIGNTAPNNRLEITSATTNTSGLRFTNLKSTSTPSASNNLGLSVDANGDVILVPAGGGGLVNPVTNLDFTNAIASKIKFYQLGLNFYGMGISAGQLNYVTRFTNDPLSPSHHVFYTGGTNNDGTELMRISSSGKVGIGTSAPGNKLEITSTANTSGLRFTNLKSTSTPSASNSLGLSVDANGDVILVPAGGGTLPQGADVWDQLSNGADYLIRNKNNKSVMIGVVAATKTNADYKLYVEKGILAEKVKVSAQANWPDYVFGKDYSLMPLKEVENYITTNNHLPEVPSADVIAKEGLDLGKMDATLLKKVEELTLYLIEQSKQLSAQQQTILKLQEKINTIEQAKK